MTQSSRDKYLDKLIININKILDKTFPQRNYKFLILDYIYKIIKDNIFLFSSLEYSNKVKLEEFISKFEKFYPKDKEIKEIKLSWEQFLNKEKFQAEKSKIDIITENYDDGEKIEIFVGTNKDKNLIGKSKIDNNNSNIEFDTNQYLNLPDGKYNIYVNDLYLKESVNKSKEFEIDFSPPKILEFTEELEKKSKGFFTGRSKNPDIEIDDKLNLTIKLCTNDIQQKMI